MTDTQGRFRYEFEYIFPMIICIGNQNMASDDLIDFVNYVLKIALLFLAVSAETLK